MIPKTVAVDVLVLEGSKRTSALFDHPSNVPLDFNRAQALARKVRPDFVVVERQRVWDVHHFVGRDAEILVGPNARKAAGELLWP